MKINRNELTTLVMKTCSMSFSVSVRLVVKTGTLHLNSKVSTNFCVQNLLSGPFQCSDAKISYPFSKNLLRTNVKTKKLVVFRTLSLLLRFLRFEVLAIYGNDAKKPRNIRTQMSSYTSSSPFPKTYLRPMSYQKLASSFIYTS